MLSALIAPASTASLESRTTAPSTGAVRYMTRPAMRPDSAPAWPHHAGKRFAVPSIRFGVRGACDLGEAGDPVSLRRERTRKATTHAAAKPATAAQRQMRRLLE